jgi:hypothetical protein
MPIDSFKHHCVLVHEDPIWKLQNSRLALLTISCSQVKILVQDSTHLHLGEAAPYNLIVGRSMTQLFLNCEVCTLSSFEKAYKAFLLLLCFFISPFFSGEWKLG